VAIREVFQGNDRTTQDLSIMVLRSSNDKCPEHKQDKELLFHSGEIISHRKRQQYLTME
jgi:hypothetical protein